MLGFTPDHLIFREFSKTEGEQLPGRKYVKISLQNPQNTSLHGGPAVFTERLLQALQNRGYYSETDYTCWMNLGFRPVPPDVLRRKPRIVMRFDGIWNFALWPSHSPGNFFRSSRQICRFLNRRSLRNISIADALIFQSDFSRAMLVNLFGNLPGVPAVIIQNGVDLQTFSPVIRDVGNTPVRQKGLRIIVSHKHWALKRSWLVPDIIAMLPSGFLSHLKVRVLGGDTANPLPGLPTPISLMKQRIAKLNLEEIFEFRGYVEPARLPDEYRWADIMLNLSFADPCPNVVVEALACGLPVVGPASGGLAELVAEEEWLVDSGEEPLGLYNPYVYRSLPGVNKKAYVEVIEHIFSSLKNHKEQARAKAETRLDINDVVDKYIDILTGKEKK